MRNASLKIYIFFVFINETVVIEKFNVFSLSLSLCNFNITPVFSFTKIYIFHEKCKR